MERVLRLIDKAAGKWLDWRTERYLQSDEELSSLGLTKGEIDMQTGVKKVEATEGGFEATFITPAVAILAEEAAKMLEMNNARNYFQFDMMPRLDRGLRPIRVTVAWAYGVMPAAKAARLEAALRTAIQYLEAWPEQVEREEMRDLKLTLYDLGTDAEHAESQKAGG